MHNQLIQDGYSSRPHLNITLQCPLFSVAHCALCQLRIYPCDHTISIPQKSSPGTLEQSPSCPASEQLPNWSRYPVYVLYSSPYKGWVCSFQVQVNLLHLQQKHLHLQRPILQAQSPKGCNWTSPPLSKLQLTVYLLCFSLCLLIVTI